MTESGLRTVEICLRRVAFAFAFAALFWSAGHAQVPSPWSNEDVGPVGLAGSASASSSTLTVRASGADIWNRADSFHFVYRALSGDGQITARVGSLTQANLLSKAGVMMRDGLGPDDPHASIFLTAGRLRHFARRRAPGGLTAKVTEGTAAIPSWMRLVRTGDVFRAYFSVNGSTWTAGGSVTIPMSHTVYVGLVATSHNQSARTTATFTNVSVQADSDTSNQLPTVWLTSPAAAATFTAPASINLAATAADADGSVTRVQFFRGTTLLGTDTASPFAYSWTDVAAGTYSLTAVAQDDDGATRTSTAVSITVNPPTTGPPRRAVFTPSVDHAAVQSYLLEIFRATDNPATATPVATRNIGKPSVVNNEISVDIATLIQALATGSYKATMSSVNGTMRSRSAPSPTFVR